MNKSGYMHFIGCGGAGMAPLALICRERGFEVSGSDLKENANTRYLENNGVKVFTGHSTGNIPSEKPLSVVYSSAVPTDNPELAGARRNHARCLTRGEMLAEIANDAKRCIAVAGSHGKTSLTAIIAHILEDSALDPGYLIGGKLSGGRLPGKAGNGDIFVAEADESDASLLHMNPFIGVINNVDGDHSWSLGGEDRLLENFAEFARNSRTVVFTEDNPIKRQLEKHNDPVSVSEKELSTPLPESAGKWKGFQLHNARMAVKLAEKLGVDSETAARSLGSFQGVERRMTRRATANGTILIEDYAHHPREVRACIEYLRESFPGKSINIVFQPHRYARLEKYFSEFSSELAKADTCYVLPVFAAWMPKKHGRNSADLASNIGGSAKFADMPWPETAELVLREMPANSVVAVLGAGDCDILTDLLASRMR